QPGIPTGERPFVDLVAPFRFGQVCGSGPALQFGAILFDIEQALGRDTAGQAGGDEVSRAGYVPMWEPTSPEALVHGSLHSFLWGTFATCLSFSGHVANVPHNQGYFPPTSFQNTAAGLLLMLVSRGIDRKTFSFSGR